MGEQQAVVMAQDNSGIVTYDLTQAVEQASANFRLIEKFVDENFRDGVDYGPPFKGSDKPTLLKPGAEKVDGLFNVRPEFEIVERETNTTNGFFYIQYRCRLVNRANGIEMGSGLGSCNSYEAKYRWRNAERVCPVCGKPTIKKSRFPPREDPMAEPGWYCYDKIGGCGANFSAKAPEIVQQEIGRIENTDLMDVWNTVDKMGQKRAHVAAALTLGFLSSRFTQDAEDFTGNDDIVDAVVVQAPKGKPAATKPTLTVAQEPVADASVKNVLAPDRVELAIRDSDTGEIKRFKQLAEGVVKPKVVAKFMEQFVGAGNVFKHQVHLSNFLAKYHNHKAPATLTNKEFRSLLGYAYAQTGDEIGFIDPAFYADKLAEAGGAPTDKELEDVKEEPYGEVDAVALVNRWVTVLAGFESEDVLGKPIAYLNEDERRRVSALLDLVEYGKVSPTLESLKESWEM